MLNIHRYNHKSKQCFFFKVTILILITVSAIADIVYAQVLKGFVKEKGESGSYYVRIYKAEDKNRSHEWQWYVYNATEDGSYGETMRVSPDGLMVRDVRIFSVLDFYWSASRKIIYLGKNEDDGFSLLLKEEYRDGRNSKNVRTNSSQERFEYPLYEISNILDIRDWEIEAVRLDGEDLIYKITGMPAGKD